MPLLGIPDSITPELLYALSKMGHGDRLVIADANFPSDSIAKECIITQPIRIAGLTSELLADILKLMPLDQYVEKPVAVMDRVENDKVKGLVVPAYQFLATVSNRSEKDLDYIERFEFYEKAKKAFAIVQTTDRTLYANCIIYKGVI